MRLSQLVLEQFRSYPALTLEFPREQNDVHVFVGENAAGKTNILEAIGLLGLTKSCQGTDDDDMIRWGSMHYRVRGTVEYPDGDGCTLEIACQNAPRRKKICLRNDVNLPVGDIVGRFPIVLFLPQDLSLFSGPPQRRRQFLDQLLCQVSPQYLQALSQYGKILRQRNSLLKDVGQRRAPADSLDIWDAQIAQAAASVVLARLELMEVLQCTLAEELASLGESWTDVRLSYERKGTATDEEAIAGEIVELLRRNRDRDVVLQATSIGPHRDDWKLLADGRSLPSFASRGQQRAAVLALVLLQVSYLELKRGERPVLLLDDVFSELDTAHQEALLRSVAHHQVFITTTHVPDQLHGAQVWNVGGGIAQLIAEPVAV